MIHIHSVMRAFVGHCLSVVVLAAALLAAPPTEAQTGQNAVIKNTNNQTTNSPSFFDATQFGGADPCVQIFNTFGALPSSGGTVDARGLTTGSPLTCSVNPIPSTAKGRLLLGSGIYLAQMPWVIQSNDVNIIGTGGGIDGGSTNPAPAAW